MREIVEKLLFGFYNDVELYFNEDNVEETRCVDSGAELVFFIRQTDVNDKETLKDIEELLRINLTVTGWSKIPVGVLVSVEPVI